jgi:hypothetical protein
MVPKSLRTWFVIHFAADYVFAIPLMIAPVWTMRLLGFDPVDPFTTRLVAAALLGIGGESFIGRNASAESFKGMLNLKILWSSGAIIGIGTTLLTRGGPSMAFVILGIFIVFNIIWVYYRIKLGN